MVGNGGLRSAWQAALGAIVTRRPISGGDHHRRVDGSEQHNPSTTDRRDLDRQHHGRPVSYVHRRRSRTRPTRLPDQLQRPSSRSTDGTGAASGTLNSLNGLELPSIEFSRRLPGRQIDLGTVPNSSATTRSINSVCPNTPTMQARRRSISDITTDVGSKAGMRATTPWTIGPFPAFAKPNSPQVLLTSDLERHPDPHFSTVTFTITVGVDHDCARSASAAR